MRVVIVGGGPAGSLCAIQLLREAKSAGRDLRVRIIEAKPFKQAGPTGCNFCAGVITARTVKRLQETGIKFPPGLIQRRIEGFFYLTEGGSAQFTKKDHGKIYSVFRGGGPIRLDKGADVSFDQVLLHRAEKLGAEVLQQRAVAIVRERSRGIVVRTADGSEKQADVVVGAFGVNSYIANELRDSLDYRPPRSIRVCQAEMALDEELISKTFGKRIFVFCLRHPNIRFLAVTPKRRYITLTAVGKAVTMVQVREYLKHPKVAPYFPVGADDLVESCHCHPRMPIGVARGAVSDRFIAIGDSCVSRYYKNGLGSAYFTASKAASTIIHHGVRRLDLIRGYMRPVLRRFVFSNFCGQLLFTLNDVTYKWPWLAAATLSYLEREKERGGRRQRLHDMMWSLFVGDRSYSKILGSALNPLLLSRMLLWDARWALGRFGRWLLGHH